MSDVLNNILGEELAEQVREKLNGSEVSINIKQPEKPEEDMTDEEYFKYRAEKEKGLI